jgi:DNA-binding NarL/FixJ family response regulator
MMTVHLCLSTQIKQLGRWRQAFPDGKIASSQEALAGTPSATLLWLHTPHTPESRIDESIQTVKANLPGIRIVVLSNTPSQPEALLALHCGAAGYCHAQATPGMLQQVATVVTNGGLWIGPELMSRILAATGQFHTPDPGHPDLELLTPREREVALAVGRGISNKEVAQQLGITDRTVKAHLGAIFEKLGVRDRLQLVVFLGRGAGMEAGSQIYAAGKSTAGF